MIAQTNLYEITTSIHMEVPINTNHVSEGDRFIVFRKYAPVPVGTKLVLQKVEEDRGIFIEEKSKTIYRVNFNYVARLGALQS